VFSPNPTTVDGLSFRELQLQCLTTRKNGLDLDIRAGMDLSVSLCPKVARMCPSQRFGFGHAYLGFVIQKSFNEYQKSLDFNLQFSLIS
jgi:hypothetical protein